MPRSEAPELECVYCGTPLRDAGVPHEFIKFTCPNKRCLGRFSKVELAAKLREARQEVARLAAENTRLRDAAKLRIPERRPSSAASVPGR